MIHSASAHVPRRRRNLEPTAPDTVQKPLGQGVARWERGKSSCAASASLSRASPRCSLGFCDVIDLAGVTPPLTQGQAADESDTPISPAQPEEVLA